VRQEFCGSQKCHHCWHCGAKNACDELGLLYNVHLQIALNSMSWIS